MEWWRTLANVRQLAAWLDDRCELPDVRECIRLFEKPWAWDSEWTAMQAELEAEEALSS